MKFSSIVWVCFSSTPLTFYMNGLGNHRLPFEEDHIQTLLQSLLELERQVCTSEGGEGSWIIVGVYEAHLFSLAYMENSMTIVWYEYKYHKSNKDNMVHL